MSWPHKTSLYIFLLVVVILACTMLIPACVKEEPPCLTCPADTNTISIDTVLVDPTEVWLKVSIPANEPSGMTLKVTRDGQTIYSKATNPPFDTTIQDMNLLPKRSYQYEASLHHGFFNIPSRTLSVTTMDTTSHTITWTTYELGADVLGNLLRDVAIINDTLVYAVGELFQRDSLGGLDTEPYSDAIWNGKKWNLGRIYPRYTGYGNPPPVRARGIFAFSATDVWLADGTAWQWDGIADTTKWRYGPFPSPDAGATKLWGTSSENMYVVGNNGMIAHYDGQGWQKQESGTNINLTDIWGSPDGSVVWACGWNDTDGRSVLLSTSSSESTWTKLWDGHGPPYIYQSPLLSLWTSGKGEFILGAGDGVYRHSLLNPDRVSKDPVNIFSAVRRIRGTNRNDIFLAGHYGMVMHYNGYSWMRYDELLNDNDRIFGLAVSKKLVIAVGTRGLGEKALVIIGKR